MLTTLRRIHRPTACLLAVVLAGAVPLLASESAAGSGAEDAALTIRLKSAIELTGKRVLSTEVHSPWKIFHGIVGMGSNFRIRDSASGQMVGAIDYMCSRGQTGGQRIFQATATGLEPLEGPTMQGHPDQFLAIFAQCGVPVETKIEVGGKAYTVRDLVERAKSDAYVGQEASWTIIAIAQYESTDAHWTNHYGQRLALEDLVAHEVSVDPTSSACGGTHNLFGLAFVLQRRRAEGRAISGVWQSADRKLHQYVELARSLQNSDGSLSTNFFTGRGRSANPVSQMYSTGHMLEWLVTYLPQENLGEPWIVRAVESLLTQFEATNSQPVECGALYHAVHSLRLYDEKRFPGSDGVQAGQSARQFSHTRGRDSWTRNLVTAIHPPFPSSQNRSPCMIL